MDHVVAEFVELFLQLIYGRGFVDIEPESFCNAVDRIFAVRHCDAAVELRQRTRTVDETEYFPTAVTQNDDLEF